MLRKWMFAGSLGLFALTGCQTGPKAEHPCATCRDVLTQERHGKHDVNRQKHDCKCPGCTECKGGGSCKATECHS